jgi:hypothetical protein
VERHGRLVAEGQGDDMSLGMAKVYRQSCYQQIGGLTPAVMWDGIDCHRARMLGWRARSWSHPDVDFVHLRPMRSSQQGALVGRFRHGRGQYFMGTALSYMLISAINWMRHPPLLFGGVAMLAGWLWGAVRGEARYGDEAFRNFLRRYHRQVLIRGKQRAMEEVLSQRR